MIGGKVFATLERGLVMTKKVYRWQAFVHLILKVVISKPSEEYVNHIKFGIFHLISV